MVTSLAVLNQTKKSTVVGIEIPDGLFGLMMLHGVTDANEWVTEAVRKHLEVTRASSLSRPVPHLEPAVCERLHE
jgi:hypothetical protein